MLKPSRKMLTEPSLNQIYLINNSVTKNDYFISRRNI